MVDLTPISAVDFQTAFPRGLVLVDFNAPWCAPCRAQEPVLLALEKTWRGRATIASVNIDENHKVAMAVGIQSIPTMILYREGREIGRFIGLQSRETLSAAIGKALAGGRKT